MRSKCKFVLGLLLVLMLVGCLSGFVNATVYTFGDTSYDGNAGNSLGYPPSGGYAFSAKLLVTSGDALYYSGVRVYAYINTTYGGVVGTAKGVVWNGTTGAVIAVGSTYTPTGWAWAYFDFAGLTLYNDTEYYFGFVCDEAGIKLRYDNGDNLVNYGSGSVNNYLSPTILNVAANGFGAIYVTMNNAAAGPTPVGTSDGDYDVGWLSTLDFAGAVSWLAVLLLFLIPPFILGVYMRGGKWGFLIGLAIGTGLSYFVFPLLVPIWLVVLIAIGLGAAFLTSVKEG